MITIIITLITDNLINPNKRVCQEKNIGKILFRGFDINVDDFFFISIEL